MGYTVIEEGDRVSKEPTKECTGCGHVKPLSGFHKCRSKRLGVHSQCKVCVSEQRKQHYQENKDKILERKRRYHQENKDKISEREKRYYQENKDKILERKKRYHQENRDKILERKKRYRQSLPSMIYEIHNTITKQVYVGQTSLGRRRWIIHKYRLRNGTHNNPHLQKAWDKWGADAFRFVVVEELPANCSEELLLEKEAALMLEHESNGKKLYNVLIGK